jgi:hypothetical protein
MDSTALQAVLLKFAILSSSIASEKTRDNLPRLSKIAEMVFFFKTSIVESLKKQVK